MVVGNVRKGVSCIIISSMCVMVDGFFLDGARLGRGALTCNVQQ